MDPNATLAKIRRLTETAANARDTDTYLGAVAGALDAFRELDEWLSRDGFLPDDWERGRCTRPGGH